LAPTAPNTLAGATGGESLLPLEEMPGCLVMGAGSSWHCREEALLVGVGSQQCMFVCQEGTTPLALL
jgi:hypothetical protein